ncbi:MAG: hypothetical protein QOJ79_940 [Actinomycetota bacterium]|jgi:hypothetical protein|nr:hypothetical protein [Actinomycetota bacterium]
MRTGGRTNVYLVLAMLAAAVAGRLLDAGALLPGITETAKVRTGGAAWLTCLVAAACLGAASSARWTGTGSIRATARLVVPGQLLSFFAAEAVVRISSGLGPVDPDGIVGALLQAGLAMVLLLVLTVAWVVLVTAAPLQVVAPRPSPVPPLTPTTRRVGSLSGLSLLARGPPMVAGT